MSIKMHESENTLSHVSSYLFTLSAFKNGLHNVHYVCLCKDYLTSDSFTSSRYMLQTLWRHEIWLESVQCL